MIVGNEYAHRHAFQTCDDQAARREAADREDGEVEFAELQSMREVTGPAGARTQPDDDPRVITPTSPTPLYVLYAE